RAALGGRPALEWVAARSAELRDMPEVRRLPRATAFGYYDGNCVFVAERRTDHLAPGTGSQLPGDETSAPPTPNPQPPTPTSRQRLWQIRARQVILATGAHERPLLFADNDRP